MTPKLRLNEAERKASLSDIEKLRHRGICLTGISTQMMAEPITQAFFMRSVIIGSPM
jgi:hypothetical protein